MHGAGLHDHTVSLSMMSSIMEAGGVNNEDFRHPLRLLKIKLNKKLLDIRNMTYDEKHEAMVKDSLDAKSLL